MLNRTPMLIINGILLLAALCGLFFASVEISGFGAGFQVYVLKVNGIVDLEKAAQLHSDWSGPGASSSIGRWVAFHDRLALTLVSLVALVAASLNLWLLRSRNRMPAATLNQQASAD